MKNLSLRIRIVTTLFITMVLGVTGTGIYSYYELKKVVLQDSMSDAQNHMNRSVQMFMVSTKKFHEQYNATDDPATRGIVLADWQRTIFAVDEAVIHDFGEGQARVRLIGDEKITGIRPLGIESTKIKSEFERTALTKMVEEGVSEYKTQDNEFLMVSIPLKSSVHPGCAECHSLPVDSDQIMGSLNVYLPLQDRFQGMTYEAMLTSGMMALVIILMIGIVYIFVERLFLIPLRRSSDYAERIASGDLTEIMKAQGKDEIGKLIDSLGDMASRIREVTGDVKKVAGDLVNSSEELDQTTNQFSDGTQSQATSVEQVMATLEEVSAGMDSIAANSANQNQSARLLMSRMETLSTSIRESGSLAQKMLTRIEEAVSVARKGEGNIRTMNETMSSIRKSSLEMTQIVEIITGISEQINLLSLNASIEAARAGDAGRGFAVVADQISRLADQTASSIKNIDGLIRQNDDEMVRGESTVSETVSTLSDIIGAFDMVADQVRNLSSAAERQLVSNDEVNREAKNISSGFEEIAMSTDSQRSATVEIVSSVEAIGQSTQKIAEGADFLSSRVKSIRETAEHLKGKIGFFKTE